MRVYKTVNDFKRNLPDILNRISFLKKERIPACQDIITEMIDVCLYDSTHGTSIVDEAIYNKARAELLRAEIELKYLTRTLNSLPRYKHHIL